MINRARDLRSDVDALYEKHVRRLPLRERLQLLARIAEDVAQTAGEGAFSDAATPVPGQGPALVEKDGLLVITGRLDGPIPDHREIRDEYLAEHGSLGT